MNLSVSAHLSLDRGLGSGRRTIRALPARVAGGDLGKLVSREPDFLCRGSSPMAPISLSIGQEPARPCDAIGQEPERAWWWWWCGWWARSVGPASEGSLVGGEEGGERGFFLAAAPDSSFNKPPAFLSFWGRTERGEGDKERMKGVKTETQRGKRPQTNRDAGEINRNICFIRPILKSDTSVMKASV